MEFNSKRYFKDFIARHLTMENAHEVYNVLESLGSGEEILFKNCLKLLGITRDEFINNFNCFAELAEIDEDRGLTMIAVAEKFGTIEYEYPDEPSYGAIKNMVIDKTSLEYVEFHQKMFHSSACELVESYDEDDFNDYNIMWIVEAVGAFHEKYRNMYTRTSELLFEIRWAMHKHNIQNAFDELGEPTDEFFDRFNAYYDSLSEDEQGTLLTLLGRAKEMINIVEKAGHDCL